MPSPRKALRATILVGGLLAASLLSCGREITGPGGVRFHGDIAIHPVFPEVVLLGSGQALAMSDVAPFERVRIVLRRADLSIAIDTLVSFPSTADSVALNLLVPLTQGTPASGEPLELTMRYVNAAGDTVFAAGPTAVTARPRGSTGSTAPVVLVPTFVGPGAHATGIAISPDAFEGTIGQVTTFSAMAFVDGDVPVPQAPILYSSSDAARVHVSVASGAATLLGARGSAFVIAQLLTGPADSALVTITPTASALHVVAGSGGQQTVRGTPFPNPIRFRVVATDNLPVADVAVTFAVTEGGGSLSVTADTSGADGFVETVWTAGDVAGMGQVTATVDGTSIVTTVTGQQLSDAPSALTFSTQPTGITAGDSLPPITVVVRDVLGDTVHGFNGNVHLNLTGGDANAQLLGTRTRQAAGGVVDFPFLTVDRAGTAYRLVASLPDLPVVPVVQSNTFNVAAAPPAVVTIVSGNGQSAPPSTLLPDSIVARVTDVFGQPIAGVQVQFAVTQGGGGVTPAAATTGATGRAGAMWTIGTTGPQALTATVTGLTPATATATVVTGGSSPALFLGFEDLQVPLSRSRSVPIYLTQPAAAPTVVTLTTQDSTVTWSQASVTIPAGATQAFATINGVYIGAAWAYARSSAGDDSLYVAVDEAEGVIEGDFFSFVVGDTVRTRITIRDPAPAGGVTFTVRVSDSSLVRIAEGTGRGYQDPVCTYCLDVREADGAPAALVAPPAGTALVRVSEGELSGHLVIVPVASSGQASVAITAEATGFSIPSLLVQARPATLEAYLWDGYVGVGHRSFLYAYLPQALRRDVRITIRSLDPEIAIADSVMVIGRGDYYSDYVHVTAIAPGTARFEVEAPGFGATTVSIDVLPAGLSAGSWFSSAVAPGNARRARVSTGYVLSGFVYGGNERAAPVTVQLSIRDPGVIAIDRTAVEIPVGAYDAEFSVRALQAGGATYLDLTAPGHVADSVLVTVSGGALSFIGSPFTTGVGLVDQSVQVLLDNAIADLRPEAPVTVTVTSSNPAIARVLNPEVLFAGEAGSQAVRIQGMAAGAVTLTASAPGRTSVEQSYQVIAPAFQFTSSFAAIDPDSLQRGLGVMLVASGNSRLAADTILAILRSSDPSVIFVSDSNLRFVAGASFSSTAIHRAIAPGTATLTVTAPGFAPLQSPTITVNPYRLTGTTLVNLGTGLRQGYQIRRTSPPGALLPFTVSRRGTANVSVLQQTDSFPANQATRNITILASEAVGRDTLTFSAAGHTSFELVVDVIASTFVPNGNTTLVLGQGGMFYGGSLRRAGFAFQPAGPRRFRITSSDPTAVEVLQDSIRFEPVSSSPVVSAQARGLRPASAWLRFTDLDGVYPTDSLEVTVTAPRLFHGGGVGFPIGMRQRTEFGEIYVQRESPVGTPLVVHIESSAPHLVSAPDSLVIPAFSSFSYFDIEAHDTVGTALITLTAEGHRPATFRVSVTRGRLAPYVSSGDLGEGHGTEVEVYLVASDYYVRRPTVDIPIRFDVDDPTIGEMVPAERVFAASGAYYQIFSGLRGLRVGESGVSVRDTRDGAFDQYTNGRAEFRVRPAALQFGARTQAVALGLSTGANRWVSSFVQPDTTVLRLTSRTGRLGIAPDTAVLHRSLTAHYFSLTGVAIGVDTLIAAAAGLRPDTAIVTVGTGSVRFSTTLPSTIRAGDSVFVTIGLRDQTNAQAFAPSTGPITIDIVTDGTVEARLGGATISTINVPANQSSVGFYIRATDAGSGSIRVSSPILVGVQHVISTRAP